MGPGHADVFMLTTHAGDFDSHIGCGRLDQLFRTTYHRPLVHAGAVHLPPAHSQGLASP